MVDVSEVAQNVYMIDDRLYSIPRAGSVYFLDEEEKALVDTGPATSSGIVIEGIKKIGRKPEDTSFVVITHIHLDHSGGVGTLLESMPRARVMVHNKAARHVINPDKLVKSAREAQGEAWMTMNGDVVPIAADKVQPVCEGDKILLGGDQVLTIMETPGHAPHELSVHESRNGGVFVGDAVAHHVPGTDISAPITPPPSFDLEQYVGSLNRLLKLGVRKLYFPHFGVSDKVEDKIVLALKELKTRNEIIAGAVRVGKTDAAADMVIAHVREVLAPISITNKALYNYWLDFDIPMSAREHVRHYLNQGNM